MSFEWAESVYLALVLMGQSPQDWKLNYECPRTGGKVALAVPEHRVGLAFLGNAIDPLLDDGWEIVRLDMKEMPSFDSAFRKLGEFDALLETRKSGSEMLKTGSSQEAALLQGILRAGLPKPDRNYRILRENGRELSVPDFTWPEMKLAFFVDGLWWHVGKDGHDKRKEVLDSKDTTAMQEAERESIARRQRDASNRSDMTIMGWTILECTDADLENETGVRKQVERIRAMMMQIRKRNQLARENNQSQTVVPDPPATPVVERADEVKPRRIKPIRKTGISPTDKAEPAPDNQPSHVAEDHNEETGSVSADQEFLELFG